MSDFTIRPTTKFIMVRAVLCVLIFLAVEIAWYTQWREQERLRFLPMVAPLVLISPLMRALRRQLTKTTISGDRLRYEAGTFSKIHTHHTALETAGCTRGPEPDAAHVLGAATCRSKPPARPAG